MDNLSKSLQIPIPLSPSAHQLAENFCYKHCTSQKGKQVYLNTLAVSAVQFYLHCMGIKTDWEASFSWNPAIQTLMDVADLNVNGLGKLECRPVLPETRFVHIPPEVWSDRIGFVAVGLDQSLREATLLGFVKTVSIEDLPVSELRSLEDLLEYLNQIGQAEPTKMRVNLSQWFESQFAAGWQPLEELLGTDRPNLALSLRSASGLNQASVKGAKLIDLGVQLGNHLVTLLVAIAPEADRKVRICVQVHPASGETYLPPQLELRLISAAGVTLQEVQSRSHDNYIQLKLFRGLPKECFNIQVTYSQVSVTENFVI